MQRRLKKNERGMKTYLVWRLFWRWTSEKGWPPRNDYPIFPASVLCVLCFSVLCAYCAWVQGRRQSWVYISLPSLFSSVISTAFFFFAPSFFLLLSLFSPPPPLVWPLPSFFFVCSLQFFFSFLQILIDVESLFHRVLKDNKLFGVYDRLKK